MTKKPTTQERLREVLRERQAQQKPDLSDEEQRAQRCVSGHYRLHLERLVKHMQKINSDPSVLRQLLLATDAQIADQIESLDSEFYARCGGGLVLTLASHFDACALLKNTTPFSLRVVTHFVAVFDDVFRNIATSLMNMNKEVSAEMDTLTGTLLMFVERLLEAPLASKMRFWREDTMDPMLLSMIKLFVEENLSGSPYRQHIEYLILLRPALLREIYGVDQYLQHSENVCGMFESYTGIPAVRLLTIHDAIVEELREQALMSYEQVLDAIVDECLAFAGITKEAFQQDMMACVMEGVQRLMREGIHSCFQRLSNIEKDERSLLGKAIRRVRRDVEDIPDVKTLKEIIKTNGKEKILPQLYNYLKASELLKGKDIPGLEAIFAGLQSTLDAFKEKL